jgi:hypothetical protein
MSGRKSTEAKHAADAVVAETPLEKTELKTTPERKPAAEGILPKKASEDDPRRWGDEPGYDHDAWLKEQRPPHWG